MKIEKKELEVLSLGDLQEIVKELEKVQPEDRRKYFEKPDTFLIFWFYYYPESFRCDLAPFHFEKMYAYACTDLNILDEGFRGSLKTEIAKIYIIKSICYKLWNYIVVQSYLSDSSDDIVINISRMLVKQTLVRDFGNLYPFSTKKEDFANKGRTNFDTTNGIRVKARAMLENLRGANTYEEDEGTSRPDLLVLDDIDTTDSVRNVEIIDKNENKLRQETIGAMSKEKQRVIFLGNTISNDGIVRRFAEDIEKMKQEQGDKCRWIHLWQPIYDDMGKCVWEEMFTPDIIENIKATEGEAWDQNYMLIPKLTVGQPVFDCKQDGIRIVRPYKILNDFHFYQPPQDQLVIGIDIAEGGVKSDNSVIKARNRKGESVFELAGKYDAIKLAQKLDWVLTEHHEEINGQKKYYLGTIMPERNVGQAFINECKKTKDDGSFLYPWVTRYLMKTRKIDGTLDEDDLIEKYGFSTNGPSKNLIISEFRNAFDRKQIDVSYTTFAEMQTYIYDKKNKANASSPNKDDRIIADMIAYWGILHEPFIAKYDNEQVDIEGMTPLQRHLYRLRNPDAVDDEYG